MKKPGFDALRTAKRVALLALLSVVFMPAAPGFAANSQMLPPTISPNSNTPCDTAHGGILQWDGNGNIVCIPAIKGDGNRNVTIQGTHDTPVNGLYTGGLNMGTASSLNANGPITISDLKKSCPGGGNVGFDGSNTLRCCPAGSVVLAVTPNSVSCGPLPITK